MTWGIIPAAGVGSRIQPLAFSKELLPVGSRRDASGVERPRAVSEHLIDRMVLGGATRICFVISPTKSDIIEYYGGGQEGMRLAYVVQQKPGGLCDAIFQALTMSDQEALSRWEVRLSRIVLLIRSCVDDFEYGAGPA